MSNASDEAPDAPESDLWQEVEPQLRDRFGDDAEIRATVDGGHVDVRVLPAELDAELGEDLDVVPYNALRMTIRREE